MNDRCMCLTYHLKRFHSAMLSTAESQHGRRRAPWTGELRGMRAPAVLKSVLLCRQSVSRSPSHG